jgi:hypothetical protein
MVSMADLFATWECTLSWAGGVQLGYHRTREGDKTDSGASDERDEAFQGDIVFEITVEDSGRNVEDIGRRACQRKMGRIDVNARQMSNHRQYDIKGDLNRGTELIRRYTTQWVQIRMPAHEMTYQYHCIYPRSSTALSSSFSLPRLSDAR